MDMRPIGVFDSGLGGLTTVLELRRLLPQENIVYFGDTSRVPYGSRSNQTILRYTKQDIRFLMSKDVKMVIAACNTASAVIAKTADFYIDVPFAGVLLPAINSAVESTKNGNIGLIGTNATVKSKAYDEALSDINNTYKLFSVACPLFVPLVENGFVQRDNKVAQLVARQYLEPLLNQSIDTLILGCTHYPIIKDIISDIVGPDVTLIDSAKEVTQIASAILQNNNSLNHTKRIGYCNYFVSDDVNDFITNSQNILREPISSNVQQIKIEEW